jgi:hypothetical protein
LRAACAKWPLSNRSCAAWLSAAERAMMSSVDIGSAACRRTHAARQVVLMRAVTRTLTLANISVARGRRPRVAHKQATSAAALARSSRRA